MREAGLLINKKWAYSILERNVIIHVIKPRR